MVKHRIRREVSCQGLPSTVGGRAAETRSRSLPYEGKVSLRTWQDFKLNPALLSYSFITKKGHKICTDPKLLWVQRYIRNLDAKKKQPSEEGAKAVGTKFAVQRRRGNSTKV